MREILHESGGIWLIACGAPQGALGEMLRTLQTQYESNSMPSITVLIYPSQKKETELADEVWVLGKSGFTGFLALIRRAAWRHFDIVIEPWKQAIPCLKYLIWPRPKWQYGIDLP